MNDNLPTGYKEEESCDGCGVCEICELYCECGNDKVEEMLVCEECM